jgi:glycosyltransferase involved in cell wall biosynthesis
MKILVLNNAAPFIRGGAEELADHLVLRLRKIRGIEAELLRLPFNWNPAERLIEEMLLHRQLRLTNVDRVIALKFPAYLVPHKRKTLWLLHQFRQAYDLYLEGHTHIGFDERGREIVQAIRSEDNRCFAESEAIYVNSPVTQKRLKTFNDVDSRVLYPPLNDPERFRPASYGDYIFAGGRMSSSKRQHLLVGAMAKAPKGLRLVVAGPPDSPDYARELEDLVARHGLEDRVDLRFGFRDRDEIGELASGALACAYLPIDEDSLGYVSMEAFGASKAVLTTTDSGGLLEIVIDGQTGRVVAPNEDAIAEALTDLWTNRTRTEAMGRAGHEILSAKNLTWDDTIKRLLS